MKIDGLTHPKTKELAFSLGVEFPHAVGLLELLWAFAAQKTPRGNIGKWSNAVIASESHWSGDPDQFVNALVECRFLDRCDTHRLLVHDWAEHCPNWVRSKLKRAGQEIISSDISQDASPSSGSTSTTSTSLAKPSQVKSSATAAPASERDPQQPKHESKGTKATVRRPEWADAQLWEDWKKGRGKPLTPTAWTPIKNQLDAAAEAGHDRNDLLRAAAAEGWRGLKLEWYENWIRKQASSGTDARTAWEQVVNASTLNSEKRREWMEAHPELRDAVNAAGGLSQIGQAQPYRQSELRDRFAAALGGA